MILNVCMFVVVCILRQMCGIMSSLCACLRVVYHVHELSSGTRASC